jgi:hypothetical protein
MLGNSWVAAQLAACQEGLSAMELVSLLQVGLEVPTSVNMKGTISWDVTRCNPEVHRPSGGTYYIHLQGRFVGNLKKQAEETKRRWPFTALYYVTYRKTVLSTHRTSAASGDRKRDLPPQTFCATERPTLRHATPSAVPFPVGLSHTAHTYKWKQT